MLKQNKMGQAQKIFIYMLIVILVGFTFLYGFKAIKTFKDKADLVQFADFKANMESSFDSIRHTFADVRQPRINVPTGFDEVCIAEFDANDIERADISDEIIRGEVETKSSNVFLRYKEETKKWIDVGVIGVIDNDFSREIAEGVICSNVESGMIRIRLEGTGNSVKVSFIKVFNNDEEE